MLSPFLSSKLLKTLFTPQYLNADSCIWIAFLTIIENRITLSSEIIAR